jgi:hypothetical protein
VFGSNEINFLHSRPVSLSTSFITMEGVATTSAGTDDRRAKALSEYRKKLLQHRELDAKVRECKYSNVLLLWK